VEQGIGVTVDDQRRRSDVFEQLDSIAGGQYRQELAGDAAWVIVTVKIAGD
jgi:hypothetical protein